MHDYRHPATAPATAPSRRRLVAGAALGVALITGSAVSLVHLTERWQAQAPVRAAREAAAKAERQAAELQDDLSGRNGDQAQEFAELKTRTDPSAADGFITEEQLVAIRAGAAPRGSTRQPVVTASSWVTEPDYTVRSSDLPPGVTASVRFNCRVSVAGRLTGCSATDSPAGTGLGRLILPQLDQARLKPMLVDGKAVESTMAFSVSFRDPPRSTIPTNRPVPAPASGMAVPPPVSGPSVANEVPATPSPEAIAAKPPEPAPAG